MMKFSRKDKKIIKVIAVIFLVWRLALLGIAWLGIKWLPRNLDFVAGQKIAWVKGKKIVWQERPLLNSWANFDGVHYLRIAREGYQDPNYAFFPFYPWLIRVLTRVIGNYLFSGLLISHLSFLGALFLFYKLVRLDFKEVITKRGLFFLLFFPTAFFFGSVYSESLFLVLVLAGFYAARQKRWLLAGILGAFASATRPVGIFLFPAFLLELWQEKRPENNFSFLISHFSLALIPLGLASYMFYLQKVVADPFYFFHIQPLFGAQRTAGKIILLYQVFWRYLKMLITVQKMSLIYFIVVLEFLTALGFLILLMVAYRQKIRQSYLLFAVLAYFLPTLTGTFSSLPRYVLVCFPCFIAMALVKKREVQFAICLLFLIFMVMTVSLFTRGFFVS